jgi:hypothetical protein
MPKKHTRAKAVWTATCLAILASLALAASASAKLTGAFTQFAQCPYTNLEVRKCLYSPTTGGTVVLGTKTVTISGEAVLQGGFGKPDKTTKFAKFYGAKNGVTLSKAPQNVPGGLLGIVPPEKSPWLVKALSAFFFENSLTGVTSTLELAQGAEGIKISEAHLAEMIGVALEMPVKLKLDNPFLGKNCYVGSSSSPIVFKLTTGETAPPGPNKAIKGTAGSLELLEEGSVLKLAGAELVDNSWSAPSASGCGGILSFLVNPIINSQIGLPSAAGKNTAILKNTINVGATAAVRLNDEDNP